MAEKLFDEGATLKIYDPRVTKQSILRDIKFYWKEIPDSKEVQNLIQVEMSIEDACEKVDSIAVLTEWEAFKTKNFNYNRFQSKIFDGRGIIREASNNYIIGK